MAEFDRCHDRIDILVNDGRSMFAAPTGEITETQWDEMQSRNTKLPFLLCQQDTAPYGGTGSMGGWSTWFRNSPSAA